MKPNSLYTGSKHREGMHKSDLYVKFKAIFDIILKDASPHPLLYRKDTYVKVALELESAVKDVITSPTSYLQPLLGYRGIGKTHFLLALLKEYYDNDNISSKKTIILKTPTFKKGYDIIYYCTEGRHLQATTVDDITGRLIARISTINKEICKQFDLSVTDNEVDAYIEDVIPEVLEWKGIELRYGKEAAKLKYILEESGVEFNNLIIVYDDLEALPPEHQSKLVLDLCAFYECICNTSKKIIPCKFFFCMRISTFSNLSMLDQFSNYRVEPPLILDKTPKLAPLFKNRFKLAKKEEKILERVGNLETWINAEEILIKLIDDGISHSDEALLQEISNYDMCEALRNIAKILSNRKWTQRDKNPSSNFIISEYDYHISQINLFRTLFMGENDVFFNSKNHGLVSPFQEGGYSQRDFITLYTILHAYKKYKCFDGDFKMLTFSRSSFTAKMVKLFAGNEEQKENIVSEINNTIAYLRDADYIRHDDFPKEQNGASLLTDNDCFYLRPRGHCIFHHMIKSSILFEIFRDDFNFDYETKYSDKLSQVELFQEYFKYIENFWIEADEPKISSIFGINEEIFYELFGDEFITELLLKGLESSINIYYRDPDLGIPADILEINKQVASIRLDIKKMKQQSTIFTRMRN